jgi:hypothetical protein
MPRHQFIDVLLRPLIDEACPKIGKIRHRIVASLALLALPALAQPTPPQSSTNPSTQSSGAGVAGLPGGKSGPAVRGPRARNRVQTKPAQQRARTMCRAYKANREIRADRPASRP